jgi:hypothetical protein
MKKELINLGSRGIVWALYLSFIVWTGGIEYDSISEFYIIAGFMICVPLAVIIFLRWSRTAKKHKKIFINFCDFGKFVLPFLLGFIICVCYWASIFIIYKLSPIVSSPVPTTQTLVDSIPKVESLGEQVSDIYSEYAHLYPEKFNKASCLDLYLDSVNLKNNFDITTACPTMAQGLDFSKITYSPAGMDEFLSLKEFLDNPKPIVQYLLDNKGYSSPQYQLLYSEFILAQYLKEYFKDGDSYYLKYILSPVVDDFPRKSFPVDIISVMPNIDLALVRDTLSSGAYNIHSLLYKITFTDNNISVELFDKIINTSSTGVSLVKYPNVLQNPEESNFGVNSWLEHKDWTFNYYGMKPFGMYPCNISYKYEFYNDRLILVSETQAKDCKKYNIESPRDIPDNFDYTSVKIYKVSPSILEKAKNLKI